MVTSNCCPWLIAQPVVCPCACVLPSVGTGEKPTEPQLLPLAFTRVNTQSVSPLVWSDVMLLKISARGTLTNKILCLCFILVTSTKKPNTATRLLISPKTRLNVVTDCQKSICHYSLLYFCKYKRLEHSKQEKQ